MDNCVVADNGFGVHVRDFGSARISGTIFERNGDPGGSGGAVAIYDRAGAQISDCHFLNNTADSGGAVLFGEGGHGSLVRCILSGNAAAVSGGAIRADLSSGVLVAECTLQGNSALSFGGAFSIDIEDRVTVTRSQILACSAPAGSALHSANSYGIQLVDTVIADNVGSVSTVEATAAPWNPQEVSIEGCTIVRNVQSQGACLNLGPATVDRTIVAFNRGSSFVSVDDTVGARFQCTDIFGNGGGDWVAGIEDQAMAAGNLSANPMFCDLLNSDYTLASGSPCLDINNGESCGTIGAYPESGCTEAAPVHFVVHSDGTGDHRTIQAALDAVIDGDTVLVTDGTFTGSGNRDLHFGGKAVTLRSQSGDPLSCVLDAAGNATDPRRLFTFDSGEGSNTVVEGITMRGGAAFGIGVARFGGAVYCAESSPTIRNCIIEDNAAERNGGAINLFHSNAVIEDCVIRGNEAPLGGGISSSSSAPIIRRTQITGNVASESGGGLRYFSQFGTSPQLDSVTVSGNQSPLGGGIACLETVALDVRNSIVWGNCADEGREFRLGDAGCTVALACSDIDTTGVWNHPDADFLFDTGDNLSLDPEFCDPIVCVGSPTVAGTFTLDAASPCSPAHSPGGCNLIGAYGVDCDVTAEAPADFPWPEHGDLTLRNEPNPFSGSTVLHLQLPTASTLELAIYDIAGKRIRSMRLEATHPGEHVLEWDGRDERGNQAAGGIYMCRATAGGKIASTTLTRIGRQ